MFENRYMIDKKRYFEWMKETSFSGKYLGFVIFWAIMAVACVIIAFAGDLLIGYVMAAYCAYRAFLHWAVITNNQYRRVTKRFGKKEWERKILFREDGIEVMDDTMSAKFAYKDVSDIVEKGNYIKIIGRKNMMIRLYADCFVDSTWEECREYINIRRAS